MALDTFTSDLIIDPPATAWDLVRLSPEAAEHIPVLWEADVAVVGGGSAGCAAAVVAARHGARTILIEAGGFFGGTAVAVLDTMYGFFPAGSEERIVGGIGWEVARAMLDAGDAVLRGNTYGAGTGVTYEPEALKIAWDQRILNSGVRPLLHARMGAVLLDGHTVRGVVVLTRRGPFRILADRVIDTSGDADVAWAAGCALEMPSAQRRVQPLTTTFRLGGVGDPVKTAELHSLMREAAGNGDYTLPRLEGSAHYTVLPGVYHTNVTRVSGIDPTNPWAATAAEIEGRKQAAEYTRFFRDRVPGYENSHLLNTSVWAGTRETRRLVGEYVLQKDDVLEARQFDDAIALCGAPIEDHDGGDATIWRYVAAGADGEPTGRAYGIPYRSLVPQDIDGLLVAGRCLSATHDAHASARSIAQCLSYGHAAGAAAAQSVATGVPLRDIDTDALRATLIGDGVLL
ncbi:FAD-dependent oxidoreductase [Microbacterium sp. DT81.1]|uniref:FAD-dependent oxidoreductase n=1 Tax=Microbacterium sp. DT81.1 TaxID=3393413 RepID=UPI003CF2B024